MRTQFKSWTTSPPTAILSQSGRRAHPAEGHALSAHGYAHAAARARTGSDRRPRRQPWLPRWSGGGRWVVTVAAITMRVHFRSRFFVDRLGLVPSSRGAGGCFTGWFGGRYLLYGTGWESGTLNTQKGNGEEFRFNLLYYSWEHSSFLRSCTLIPIYYEHEKY